MNSRGATPNATFPGPIHHAVLTRLGFFLAINYNLGVKASAPRSEEIPPCLTVDGVRVVLASRSRLIRVGVAATSLRVSCRRHLLYSSSLNPNTHLPVFSICPSTPLSSKLPLPPRRPRERAGEKKTSFPEQIDRFGP